MTPPRSPWVIAGIFVGILVLGLAAYGEYRLFTAYQTTQQELASSTEERSTLSDELANARAHNEELSQELASELDRNTAFATQINDIASTVGTLTKLSQTDKELLEKYSRVYFLNENYVPSDLAEIPSEDTLEPARHLKFHAKALPFLEHMLTDAEDAGSPLLVLSSYRSFADQKSLKTSYTFTYGTGSNRFSADQGYSEHQLGTAVDLTTKQIAATSLAFATSPAGKWLDANAYKYGFVLSYPKGNTYYQYEPWHWRFVGVELATKLHDENLHFYDLPQRDIDQYLVGIFDN